MAEPEDIKFRNDILTVIEFTAQGFSEHMPFIFIVVFFIYHIWF